MSLREADCSRAACQGSLAVCCATDNAQLGYAASYSMSKNSDEHGRRGGVQGTILASKPLVFSIAMDFEPTACMK